jgi:hypothetical protein
LPIADGEKRMRDGRTFFFAPFSVGDSASGCLAMAVNVRPGGLFSGAPPEAVSVFVESFGVDRETWYPSGYLVVEGVPDGTSWKFTIMGEGG